MPYTYTRSEDDDDARPLPIERPCVYGVIGGGLSPLDAFDVLNARIARIEAWLGLSYKPKVAEVRGNRDIGWRVFVDDQPITEPMDFREADRIARDSTSIFPPI